MLVLSTGSRTRDIDVFIQNGFSDDVDMTVKGHIPVGSIGWKKLRDFLMVNGKPHRWLKSHTDWNEYLESEINGTPLEIEILRLELLNVIIWNGHLWRIMPNPIVKSNNECDKCDKEDCENRVVTISKEDMEKERKRRLFYIS